MNKKGFTLIELLAVIVILAVIALIATPIMLGIINDAKKDAAQQSINLYAKSIETEFMMQALKGNADVALPTTGTKVVAQSILDAVDMKNKPTCDTVTIDSRGVVVLSDCTANGISGLSTSTVIEDISSPAE